MDDMEINNVCVIGGSGFIGRHIAHQLVERGLAVRVPTRNREQAKELIVLPTVDVVEADVHDGATLDQLFAGMDAVINLAGILQERRKGEFRHVHVELPRKIIAACKRAGIRRLIHMSALNADPAGPSGYLRSKGEGEGLVLGCGLEATVFRPSVVFGREDTFLNLFASLLRRLPVIALACPGARFQPVFVEDVARAFVESLADPRTFGRRYDLCGPKVYTLRELVEYVGRITGHERPIIGLSDRLSYLQAWAMEWLPVKLMTRDNYYSMKVDSVCRCGFPEIFGFKPTPLEAVVPLYLRGEEPRARYSVFRYRARR